MGYGIRPGLVAENRALLTLISITAIGKGRPCRVPPFAGMNVYQTQWHVRRVLKATEVLEDECEGQFAGLGRHLSIKVDTATKEVIVYPKGGASLATFNPRSASRPDEDAALSQLAHSTREIELVSFVPSPRFAEDTFIEAALEAGWIIYPSSKQDMPDGSLMYGAERNISTSDPFSAYADDQQER